MQSLKDHLGTAAGVTDTPAQILTKLKSVDGAGSGLDADLVQSHSMGTLARQDANNVIITGGSIDVANVTATTVTANTFIGDGSQLTGISSGGVTTGKAIAMAMVFG
jgi:hypothetical protein